MGLCQQVWNLIIDAEIRCASTQLTYVPSPQNKTEKTETRCQEEEAVDTGA